MSILDEGEWGPPVGEDCRKDWISNAMDDQWKMKSAGMAGNELQWIQDL